MGTAVRPAKTSHGLWDAFADVDVFVDAVLAELEAMAKDGTRPMRSGPQPPLTGAECGRPGRRSGASTCAACSGGRSDCCAASPSGTLYGLLPAGPGSASGGGGSASCTATGGALVGMLRNLAPWLSTADPAARRRVVRPRHRRRKEDQGRQDPCRRGQIRPSPGDRCFSGKSA
jgi:hypothetical protein